MHDCHDHVVALGRLFEKRVQVSSLFDLQLAQEALTADARNTFGDALCAFRACDNPYA